MNRRIKELAADAGYPDYMTYGQDKVLEKFAELIVQECSEFVKGRAEKAMSQEILAVGDELVKHFRS